MLFGVSVSCGQVAWKLGRQRLALDGVTAYSKIESGTAKCKLVHHCDEIEFRRE